MSLSYKAKTYFANMDRSMLRKSIRIAPKMTMDEFQALIFAVSPAMKTETGEINLDAIRILLHPDGCPLGQVFADLRSDIIFSEKTIAGQGCFMSKTGIPFLYYFGCSSSDHIMAQDQAAFMVYFDGNDFRAYCPHYGNFVDLTGNIGLSFDLTKDRFPRKLSMNMFHSVSFDSISQYEHFRAASQKNWIEPCKTACFKDFELAVRPYGEMTAEKLTNLKIKLAKG